MTQRRRKPRRGGGLTPHRYSDAQEKVLRELAFAAIRALYWEVVPLWRTCRRGYCRRHQRCSGEARACLKRTWPGLSEAAQDAAYAAVQAGGPRRLSPKTQYERRLRRYPPSNFTH